MLADWGRPANPNGVDRLLQLSQTDAGPPLAAAAVVVVVVAVVAAAVVVAAAAVVADCFDWSQIGYFVAAAVVVVVAAAVPPRLCRKGLEWGEQLRQQPREQLALW